MCDPNVWLSELIGKRKAISYSLKELEEFLALKPETQSARA